MFIYFLRYATKSAESTGQSRLHLDQVKKTLKTKLKFGTKKVFVLMNWTVATDKDLMRDNDSIYKKNGTSTCTSNDRIGEYTE
jgi:hypothetical protein